jgi:hypothetical protein
MQQFRLSNSQAILLSKWVLDNALSWWCMPCLSRRENILSRPSVQTGYFLKRGPDHLPIFERCLLSVTSIFCNWGHSHDAGLSYCDSKTVSLELLSRLNAWSKCPTILSWWTEDDRGDILQRSGVHFPHDYIIRPAASIRLTPVALLLVLLPLLLLLLLLVLLLLLLQVGLSSLLSSIRSSYSRLREWL